MNPAYIDPVLAGGLRQGYQFTYLQGPVRVVKVTIAPGVTKAFNVYDTYTLQVDPINVNVTGTRRFFVNETGVLRVNELGKAGPLDVPLE